MRIALFTNNYLPFCGGVTISVETLRRGLEARGHEAWVFAPRFPGAVDEAPRIVRYPSMPGRHLSGVHARRAVARRAPRAWSGASTSTSSTPIIPSCSAPPRDGWARRAGRPLVFTYHTRYEKYAHYVPLTRPLVEAAAVRLSTRFASAGRRRGRALDARARASCVGAA